MDNRRTMGEQVPMGTRERIVAQIGKEKVAGSSDLAKELGLSRKTIAVHVKKLVEEGRLIKTGATRNARYRIAKGLRKPAPKKLTLIKVLRDASEHLVFSEVNLRLNLRKELSATAFGVAQYAFTEMFNNAIDHSKSRKAEAVVTLERGLFVFHLRDYGIGLFTNIQDKFEFADEYEAVDHVLKGKQTTQPDRHTGEGLFFTSRIADQFVIRSHKILLTINNEKRDYSLGEKRFLRGTEIRFSIKKQTRKDLKALFDKYSNEDFEFKTGELRVKLSADAGNISRSQARRLCFGLEKFDRVVFDFHGVTEIGQAFADEIFRVFAQRHPNKEISFRNAIRPVEFMVLRSIRQSGSS